MVTQANFVASYISKKKFILVNSCSNIEDSHVPTQFAQNEYRTLQLFLWPHVTSYCVSSDSTQQLKLYFPKFISSIESTQYMPSCPHTNNESFNFQIFLQPIVKMKLTIAIILKKKNIINFLKLNNQRTTSNVGISNWSFTLTISINVGQFSSHATTKGV